MNSFRSILALALLLRLIWAVLIPVVPISDSVAYDAFARTLVFHGVYGWNPDQPSAYWPVGTAAVYAGLYSIFGVAFVPIVALNVILGTAIVGATMWLARILFNARIAIVAGGLMAVWPSQIAFVTVLASELPFTLLVLLGAVAWYRPDLSSLVRGMMSGFAFGAAAYFRPVALLLPFVMCLSFIPNWRKLLAQVPTLTVSIIALAIVVTPWSIRNTALFGNFVLISTNGGANLWMGNNPGTRGYYMPLPSFTEAMTEYERDKALGEIARTYILENPVGFVERTLQKAVLFHLSETIAVGWNEEGIRDRFGEAALFPLKVLTQGFWIMALLLALIGIAIIARQWGIVSTVMNPIVLIWLYFTAVHAVIVIQDRYHFPCHPFIAILAAIAIVTIATRRLPLSVCQEERAANFASKS